MDVKPDLRLNKGLMFIGSLFTQKKKKYYQNQPKITLLLKITLGHT